MNRDVFICYPSEKRDFAKRLTWQLGFYGFKVWVDFNDLPPGQHVDKQITDVIAGSSVFLYLFTLQSLGKKGYQQQELAIALGISERVGQQFFILQIPIERVAEMPLPNLETILLFQDDWDAGFNQLLERVAFLKQTAHTDPGHSLINTRWVWPNLAKINGWNHYVFDLRRNGELWYMDTFYRNEWNDRPVYERQLNYDEFTDPPFAIGKWEVIDNELLLTFDQFVYQVGFSGARFATFRGVIHGDEIKGDFGEDFFAWPDERDQALFLCTRTEIKKALEDCVDYAFCKKNLYDHEPLDEHSLRMKSITFKDISLPREQFNEKFKLNWPIK